MLASSECACASTCASCCRCESLTASWRSNIFGPQGTWKGGREKAPAAFCRKVIASKDELEIWGDGLQTRSFCIVDDCVEGCIVSASAARIAARSDWLGPQRFIQSDYKKPLNIGSDFLISMNDMAKLVMTFENKNLKLKHIPGPQGVRGRNSDNSRIKQVLGWAPSTPLEVGLRKTYVWIKEQIEYEAKHGQARDYSKSEVVVQSTDSLDHLGATVDK